MGKIDLTKPLQIHDPNSGCNRAANLKHETKTLVVAVFAEGWNEGLTVRFNKATGRECGPTTKVPLVLRNVPDSKRSDERDEDDEESPEEETDVIFRKFKGEIIALFPQQPGLSSEWYQCSCYVSVGQHSAADIDHVINNSSPAQPCEYELLKLELESPPYKYNLRVKQRQTPQHRAQRKENWKRGLKA